MQKTMPVKGFILILALVLAVFLCFHLMMKGDLSRKDHMVLYGIPV